MIIRKRYRQWRVIELGGEAIDNSINTVLSVDS